MQHAAFTILCPREEPALGLACSHDRIRDTSAQCTLKFVQSEAGLMSRGLRRLRPEFPRARESQRTRGRRRSASLPVGRTQRSRSEARATGEGGPATCPRERWGPRSFLPKRRLPSRPPPRQGQSARRRPRGRRPPFVRMRGRPLRSAMVPVAPLFRMRRRMQSCALKSRGVLGSPARARYSAEATATNISLGPTRRATAVVGTSSLRRMPTSNLSTARSTNRLLTDTSRPTCGNSARNARRRGMSNVSAATREVVTRTTPAASGPMPVHVLGCPRERVHGDPNAGAKLRSRLRCDDHARGSVKKANAERRFEQLHGLAQRRRRYAEVCCGFR